MADTINEDTVRDLTLSFTDKDGTPKVPNSLWYRIRNVESGRQVRGWTEFAGALDTSVVITLTAEDTCILNPANETETHKLQAHTEDAHYEYEYVVTNLDEPIVPVIVRGDDYTDDNGRAIKFTNGAGWPSLAGATFLFEAFSNSVDTTLSVAGTLETGLGTGSRKTVLVALTSAQTLALEAASKPYRYKLTATLDGSGAKWTLASGTMSVVER